MPASDPPRWLVQYLAALFDRAREHEFLELRFRRGDDAFSSRFFAVHDYEAAAREIRARAAQYDVYVGCAPRSRRAGTKDAIAAVHTLWAECDGRAAAQAALSWRPAPSIVVASGSGPNVHAYWLLERALEPAKAEAANLRLAKALGADAACFDAGRILRPPGTWNHKHEVPRPVALLRLTPDRVFNVEEVIARSAVVDLDAVTRRWERRPGRDDRGDPLLRLRPDIYVSALLGLTPNRARKVRCPFHEDERPSLHVYATAQRGWTCFSCRRGGSVYDLAAALWGFNTRGQDFVRLRRRLLEVFSAELAATVTRERE